VRLNEITAFIRRTGMAETAFGRKVANDPRLIGGHFVVSRQGFFADEQIVARVGKSSRRSRFECRPQSHSSLSSDAKPRIGQEPPNEQEQHHSKPNHRHGVAVAILGIVQVQVSVERMLQAVAVRLSEALIQ